MEITKEINQQANANKTNYQISKKRYNTKEFFEGWYFKHQCGDQTFAFIPGINIDEKGNRSAFMQFISNIASCYIEYPFSDFETSDDSLFIKIKNNVFTEKGIYIDMQYKNIQIKGKIDYGKLTPIKSDIMGPFRFLPFMECRHGIISLFHDVKGEFSINGQIINMHNSIGYIEKDWGRSFPKSYVWTQCSDDKRGACCVMLSVADIPYAGLYFKGCICSIYCNGKEYRLATYKGVKIVSCGKSTIELRQGKYRLIVELNENSPQQLKAPINGNMSRTIHENTSCAVRYKFFIKNKLELDLNSERASFEFVE